MNAKDDKQMLNEWEKGYIVVPRFIVRSMYNLQEPHHQKLAELYFILFCFCFHTDGQVKLSGNTYTCHRGEYIGKQETLARLMGISPGYCHKLLKKLVDKEWITLKKIEGGSRIRVNGYSDFVQGKYPGQKSEKAKKKTPQEAFAWYLKAIQEGRYLSASDLDF